MEHFWLFPKYKKICQASSGVDLTVSASPLRLIELAAGCCIRICVTWWTGRVVWSTTGVPAGTALLGIVASSGGNGLTVVTTWVAGTVASTIGVGAVVTAITGVGGAAIGVGWMMIGVGVGTVVTAGDVTTAETKEGASVIQNNDSSAQSSKYVYQSINVLIFDTGERAFLPTSSSAHLLGVVVMTGAGVAGA